MISRFLSGLEDSYDEDVLEYVGRLAEVVTISDELSSYLDMVGISLELLANNALPLCQRKLNMTGNPELSELEISVVLHGIRLDLEITRLLDEGHMKIESISGTGTLLYALDDHAAEYFRGEWNALPPSIFK